MRSPAKTRLSTTEAAAVLGVSVAEVENKIGRGTLPYVGLSPRGDYVLAWRDVLAYQQRRRAGRYGPRDRAARPSAHAGATGEPA